MRKVERMTVSGLYPTPTKGLGLVTRRSNLKKMAKRLALHRETLGNLDEDRLTAVNGGLITDASCANSCDPVSVRLACTHSRNTC
jgi:hypothetical protein